MTLSGKTLEAGAKKTVLEKQLDTRKKQLAEFVEDRKVCEDALNIVQRVALETQEQLRYNLEDIVNTMLQAVYGDIYTFAIIYDTKYNKTEARMVLMDNGEESDILNSVGGGVVDLLTVALRIALLLLSSNRQVLVLDEPGKMLSEDIRAPFYQVLKSLSTDLGVQIIMVSHDNYALQYADKIIRVGKNEEGKSYAV